MKDEEKFLRLYGVARGLYNVPSRAYHNLDHVRFCLDQLMKVYPLLDHPDDARMALLFHDAIYNSRRTENEEMSAKMADLLLSEVEWPEDCRRRVIDLILATKHDRLLTDKDAQYVADIDLASLGLPWRKFNRNSKRIREEYSWVGEDRFNKSRAAIVRNLLTRPNGIYYTPYFKKKYGSQAAQNLERHIRDLMGE